ncbi:LemA family protein [Patescibacteria group bacterium]|nr:LemA family protein [Patescibacteria group bacterium]
MTPLLVVGGLVLVVLLFLWSLYNGFVTLKAQIEEAWSQIDVQLKRRIDLIPNLVESVKGYAKHEKSVFENVTKARSALMKADTPESMAKASDTLTGALKSLFAVAENYPQLRANENFLQLQRELSDTEDKVAYARQFYNSTVMDYNVKVRVFPNALIANAFGFKEQPFFKATDEERKGVKVEF